MISKTPSFATCSPGKTSKVAVALRENPNPRRAKPGRVTKKGGNP
jgi:hypothetical protein